MTFPSNILQWKILSFQIRENGKGLGTTNPKKNVHWASLKHISIFIHEALPGKSLQINLLYFQRENVQNVTKFSKIIYPFPNSKFFS